LDWTITIIVDGDRSLPSWIEPKPLLRKLDFIAGTVLDWAVGAFVVKLIMKNQGLKNY